MKKTPEWQVDTVRWRRWMLTSLGCVPLSCGGRVEVPQAQPADGVGSAITQPGSGRPLRGGGRPPRDVTARGPGGLEPVSGTASRSACESPTPLGGGWELCANGVKHRAEVVGQCDSALPRAGLAVDPALYGLAVPEDADVPEAGAPLPPGFACLRDSDCDERPYGHCEQGQLVYCAYGCVSDSDCAANEACLCGEPVGQCVPAACRVDSDCPAGLLCADYLQQPFCGGPAVACQSRSDACVGTADCETCTIEEGNSHRTCSSSICVIGRPFLVGGAERLASPARRADWLWQGERPDAAAASGAREAARAGSRADNPELRAALAKAWTEQALMEHASVAAFARFTLQLMSLGAPAELLGRATRAMADETRHAQLCFSLARRYSGEDIGPGPLSMAGALDAADVASIVLTTVQEGCIGETVAAIEAAEALAHCEDGATREVLEQIARDEAEHAELAWRFVAWAVERWPELSGAVRAELAGALENGEADEEPALVVSASEGALLARGIVSPSVRSALRRRVLVDVVLPCADALLPCADALLPCADALLPCADARLEPAPHLAAGASARARHVA